MAAKEVPTQLLQLPDPCLLAVLQCCADDPRSVCSAARAHSRLHQAAVAALSSITARIVKQRRAKYLLKYLSKHGQHVDSMDLAGVDRTAGARGGDPVSLRQLPPNLQLNSLKLARMAVQLQPEGGSQGVVRPGLPLKQLRLIGCSLVDWEEGLAAALALLPGLQHLCISMSATASEWGTRHLFWFPASVLSGLQQLTYLELAGVAAQGDFEDQWDSEVQGGLQEIGADFDYGEPALQPLQALTRLADLRLSLSEPATIDSSMLSGAVHLTRLVVGGIAILDLAALAGKAQLQHLELTCRIGSFPGKVAQLLSQLQGLQQLTHLCLQGKVCLKGAPEEALSILTASSKLQRLDIAHGMLPASVLLYMFRPNRQLQHLQSLKIFGGADCGAPSSFVTAFDGTRLVSCCPGLQSLDVRGLQDSAELLVPLQGLSGLHSLLMESHDGERFKDVCQLTGLRSLYLKVPYRKEGLLLELTQLQQLTSLTYLMHGSSLNE